jgi:hypothetical protein
MAESASGDGGAGGRPRERAGGKGRPRGGIDVFDALSVRFGIRAGGTDAVRDLLAAWVGEDREGGARWLLPFDGIDVCTVFLDGGEPDALVWYVQVDDDDREPWVDPAAAIRESPLFAAGLGDLLTGEPTVLADGVDGAQLVVTATHPDRQAWYEAAGGRPLVAPVAGEELPVAVAMVAVPLRAGPVSWLAARGTRLVNWLKRATPLGERFRDDVEILAEERLYGESLLLAPGDGRQVLHYYVETERIGQLYDAFEASTDWKARVGGWLLRRLLARPAVLLDPPLESDYEVLLHAVDPERA